MVPELCSLVEDRLVVPIIASRVEKVREERRAFIQLEVAARSAAAVVD